MAKKIHKFKNFRASQDGIELRLDLSNLSDRLNRAQYALDSAVMTSMVPYMPMQNGNFIDLTRAKSASMAGSGEVYAAVPPAGRFLYEGKVMVDAQTGKGPMRFMSKYGEETFRFRKGAKLKATDRPLQYSKHANPKTQSHWFDAAKAADMDKWENVVKKEIGK